MNIDDFWRFFREPLGFESATRLCGDFRTRLTSIFHTVSNCLILISRQRLWPWEYVELFWLYFYRSRNSLLVSTTQQFGPFQMLGCFWSFPQINGRERLYARKIVQIATFRYSLPSEVSVFFTSPFRILIIVLGDDRRSKQFFLQTSVQMVFLHSFREIA